MKEEESRAYQSLYEANSPLQSAPPSLQEYFKSLKTVVSPLPQLQHEFQLKPSPTFICTKILKPQDKYYYCEDCAVNQPIASMIFCETCFDKQLHEGHNFVEKVVSNNQCSCDCGRKMRLKEACFCSVHAQKNKQVEIKEEDAQKFNQYFLSLFRILLFLQKKKQETLKPLVDLISNTLISLCQESLYYSRLTSRIFNTAVCLDQSEEKIGEQILKFDQFGKLLLLVVGDRDFLLEFGEVFVGIQEKGTMFLFQFNNLRRQFLDSEQFLIKMAKKGVFFPEELNNYFSIASRLSSQQQRNNFITQLLTKITKKLDPAEYVDLVCTVIKQDGCEILKDEKFLNQILTNVLSNYKNKEDAAQEKKEGEQQKKNTTNQEKLALKKSLSIVNKIILQKCKQNVTLYQSTLEKIILSKQQLKNYFNNLVERFIEAELFNDLQKQVLRPILFLVLFAVDKHPKNSELLVKIWNSIILSSKPFNENLDSIYEIVAFLANSYRSFSILGGNQEQLSKFEEKELKEKLFKSYLFENKELSKKDLWSQFNEGWLKFDRCGKVLNELCEYQDNTDTFIYKSKLSYPNPLLKIPLELSRNWENVRKMQVSYDWPDLSESVTLKKLFLTLFRGDQFYNIFQQSFIRSLETIEKQPRTLERWKNRGIGQNYITILLIITKLGNGQVNTLIIQEILKIMENQDQYRFRFTEIGNEDKIKKMLCVDLPVENKVEEQNAGQQKKQQKSKQQLEKEQMFRKSQQKKLKMQKKMKQKQNNTLQKIRIEKSSVVEEEQQNYCLSCKERQKKDNQFVVLLCLNRGNTISKILHAEQSKTSVKISTNLHTIHINCFKEMKKKNMEFNCPLCKQNINCFLPYRPNRASALTLEICWNVFNAVLVSCCNFYETGCLFDVLLDALVQSCGFTELVSAKKSKNIIKLKNKSDLHLIQMLTCLYSFASQSEKQKYKSCYNKLKQKIKTCTRKQIQLFQLVILDAIFFRVTGQIEIQTALVEKLSKYMIEEELKILKNTLIFITEGNSEAISSLDDLSSSRIEEESPRKKIEQMPTSLENLDEPNTNTEQKTISNNQIVLQRKSLGINIKTPPKKLAHLLSKDYLKQNGNTGKCGCQSSQPTQICLICRKIFCQKCDEDKLHLEMHLGNFITLNLQDARLIIHKGPKQEKHDIYFNDFMIQYKKSKEDDDEGSDNEEGQQFVLFKPKKIKEKKDNKQALYGLNLTKFNELVQRFYNLNG